MVTSDYALLLYCLRNKKDIDNYNFIYDYFFVLEKMKYCIRADIFSEAIQLCQNDENLFSYQSFIEQNYNKLKIYLT